MHCKNLRRVIDGVSRQNLRFAREARSSANHTNGGISGGTTCIGVWVVGGQGDPGDPEVLGDCERAYSTSSKTETANLLADATDIVRQIAVSVNGYQLTSRSFAVRV
jgi:hypothetical protein